MGMCCPSPAPASPPPSPKPSHAVSSVSGIRGELVIHSLGLPAHQAGRWVGSGTHCQD